MNEPITCRIYRPAASGPDESNGGLTSRVDEVLLFATPDDVDLHREPALPGLILHRRHDGYLYAVPIERPKPGQIAWRFGGNFLYSADALFPCFGAIPVHDRQDTVEELRAVMGYPPAVKETSHGD